MKKRLVPLPLKCPHLFGKRALHGLFDLGEKYGVSSSKKTIFFVPSLINKAYIFDLIESYGFLSYLAAQGIRSYLFDWGECNNEEAQFSLKDILGNRLLPAFQFAHQREGRPLFAGGLLYGWSFISSFKGQNTGSC